MSTTLLKIVPLPFLFQVVDALLDMYRMRLKKDPSAFVSKRIAILDTAFQQQWSTQYKDWLRSRVLPRGYSHYYNGEFPQYAATNRQWVAEVDTLYSVLNVNESHWVSMVISIPNRTILLYDCIPDLNDEKTTLAAAKPFADMVPHLIYVTSVGNVDVDPAVDIEKYSIKLVTEGVPRSEPPYGDCGIYAVKFIECLIMGVKFDSKHLCDDNMANVRMKLASEMYAETSNSVIGSQ